jgi:myo-inositol 2-dehydrogenase/D-chiro-inositol 1-dehydrogenase
MDRIAKLGFVGCGTHSTNNIYPALKYARCRLTAVCDLNETLAKRNASIFGAARAYTSAETMLVEEELDGVLIVGDPRLHFELGRKVLERGIPLFVEKPPAPSLAQAEELVRIAKEHRTFVMAGFMKRFALTYRKIREFIASGEFDVSSGFFRYTHWASNDLRGMLLGMSIHPIDLAISFFGDVSDVSSVSYDAHGALSLGLTLKFKSGKWAQLMLGCHGPRIQEHVELSGVMNGKHSCFVVDDIIKMELHSAGQGGVDVLVPELYDIRPQFDLDDIRVWRPDFGIPNMGQNSLFLAGYAGEIREFVDAILERRIPNGGNEDALKAMRVIDEVLKRAGSQQPSGQLSGK